MRISIYHPGQRGKWSWTRDVDLEVLFTGMQLSEDLGAWHDGWYDEDDYKTIASFEEKDKLWKLFSKSKKGLIEHLEHVGFARYVTSSNKNRKRMSSMLNDKGFFVDEGTGVVLVNPEVWGDLNPLTENLIRDLCNSLY